MDPKQQARSHEMFSLLGVGTNLQLYVYKTLTSMLKLGRGNIACSVILRYSLLYIFSTYIWSMTKLKYDVTVEGSNLLP